jgi:chlorophyllide a reductase subunit Y
MKAFFDGVGEGYAAGVWEERPHDRPGFRRKRLAQQERRAKSKAIGC